MTGISLDRGLTLNLLRNMQQAQRENSDSLAKLSSGQVFTAEDPRPTDRALAAGLEQKLRTLAATKRNINDAVSLLQTAESGFSEVTNIVTRMKEIGTEAASATLSNVDRRFLMVEYNALFHEIDRIASTAEFQGIPLLNGSDQRTPEQLSIRVGENPQTSDENNDLAVITLKGLHDIVSTTVGLGLHTAVDLLRDSDEGIALEAAIDLLTPGESRFATVFDEALEKLSGFRAQYGALQNRLNRALEYHEVASENISAARSQIADTDYAAEAARLTQSNMLLHTTTALLTQNNLASGMAVKLVNSLLHEL